MRCASCGHTVPDGDRFCEVCGKPVASDSTPPAALTTTPVAADARLTKTERSTPPTSGDGSGAAVRHWGWVALCVVLYVAIADAAGEAFVHQAPARWWIAAGTVVYLGLSALTWRLAPALWKRIDWPVRATVSLVLLIGGLALVIRAPNDAQAGITLFGAPASLAATVITLLACAAAGVVLARYDALPVGVRVAAAVLGVYGIIALGLAIRGGTPYGALFHGASQWVHLPMLLQGAVLGAFLLVPAAGIAELLRVLAHRVRAPVPATVFGTTAFGMCVVLALVAWRSGGGPAGTELADAIPSASPDGTQQPVPAATPAESAAYQRASDQLSKLNSGVDAINQRYDRSVFEVNALADKLGANPAALLHFVRDEIRYEPYVGVLRGPAGALACRAANSLDRSLLLAALLKQEGFSARIAGGKLGAAAVSTLLARVFEPAKSIPVALPWSDSIVSELTQALGVRPADFLRAAAADSASGAATQAAWRAEVDSESTYLAASLRSGGVRLPAAIPVDRLGGEVADHYWVEFQDSAGRWVDLDPAFPSAEPGATFTTATMNFTPDAVPESLYHHLHITMTLRVSPTETDKGDTTQDRVILDQELRVSEQFGVGVFLANLPVPNPEFLRAKRLGVAVAPVRGFQPVLQVGNQITQGQGFDINGQPFGAAQSQDPNVAQAGGIGGSNGGLLGGMTNAVSGQAPASAPTTRVVGEWVDYTLSSPGMAGGAIRTRTVHRDIVAPVTVTGWSASARGQPSTRPTTLAPDAVRSDMVWFTRLLPVSGTTIPGYTSYIGLQALSMVHSLGDYYAKRLTGVPVDAPGPAALLPAVGSLVLADQPVLMEQSGDDGSKQVRAYFATPGLIGYETRLIKGVDGPVVRSGYDIMAYAPRVVSAKATEGTDNDPGASTLLRLGVRVTALEAALMVDSGSGGPAPGQISASRVFRAARGQHVRAVLLRPGAAGMTGAAAVGTPDSVKAELAANLLANNTLVVPEGGVQVDGRPQIAWWRVDGTTGEVLGIMPGGRGQAFTEYITEVVEIGLTIACSLESSWNVYKAQSEGKSAASTAVGLALDLSMCALAAYSGDQAGALTGVRWEDVKRTWNLIGFFIDFSHILIGKAAE